MQFLGKNQMYTARRNKPLVSILLASFLFFSACGSHTLWISKQHKSVTSLAETRELISILENTNIKLKTFKGVGRITIWKQGKKDLPGRLAWIGLTPDNFRIALQSVSGQPVASLANDGQWIYVFSHAQGQFLKQRSTNFAMKKFFSIPIKSSDIVNILAGRVPVNKHNSAIVIKDTPARHNTDDLMQQKTDRYDSNESGRSEDGYVLILKKRWGNICEKIYLDANKRDVRKFEVFDANGALAYRAEFSRMQHIKGHKVPSRLVLSGGDGSGFQLDVDRYWVNASVSPSIFVLKPPE